jgi:serine/threonine protein kinase/dipeptidyl aminopeptidase/acylaminoacyl peptidase
MNGYTSSSPADINEEILAQFVEELEKRGSQAIEDYVHRYPELAGRIHALLQTRNAVQQARPEAEPGIPERLGVFRIVREIGHGGMGVIYEAIQDRLNRRVAVKVIRHGRILPEARDRFLREQEVLARLHQTNIVAIHTAGEEGQLQYFAMPYIEGAALQHVVQTVLQLETVQPGSKTPSLARLASMLAAKSDHAAERPSSVPPVSGEAAEVYQTGSGVPGGSASSTSRRPVVPAEGITLSPEYFRSVAEVMIEASEALQHAHGARILHRDMKPSNLMVDTSGRCWLIDFGLARFLNGHDGTPSSSERFVAPHAPVTVSGVRGTPQYMAPEQFESRADIRTDVWGLGVTLYQLLTLRTAFDGQSYDEIRKRILASDPLTPHKVVRSVPVDLGAICRKAMQKQPKGRYQTAQEFADDLRRWLRMEPTRARPAWAWRRAWLWSRRNKGWATAIGIAILALVGLSRLGGILHERNKEALRQRLIQQAQRIRLTRHSHGWFQRAWPIVREAATIRSDEQLRDQAAALLHGLDATSQPGMKGDASSVAFSSDGTRLLVGGSADDQGKPNGPARLWKLGIEEPSVSDLPGEGPVAFASDGAALQCVPDPENRYTLKLWNVEKRSLVRELKLVENTAREPLTVANRFSLALASDGSLVAASTRMPDGKPTLVVWEAASGKPVKRLDKDATAIAFSPDGRLLAAGDATGTIALWNLKQAGEPLTLQRTRTAIHCLAFTRDRRWFTGKNAPGGTWLVAAGDGGSDVTIWDLQARQALSICRGFSRDDVFAVAFNPDGTLLVSAGREYPILWDVANGKSLLQLPDRNWMTGAAFSPDGKRLAVTSKTAFTMPGGVDVSQLDDGRGIRTLRGLASRIERIILSPDGRFLAAIGVDWRVSIWEFASGRLLHILDVPEGISIDNVALAFSPNGDRFAFAAGTKALLWELSTGKQRDPWILPPGLCDRMAFDGTGKRLLLARAERKNQLPIVRFYELLSSEPTKAFAEREEFKLSACVREVAPDGSYFVLSGVLGQADEKRHLVEVVDGATAKNVIFSVNVSTPSAHTHPSFGLDAMGKLLVYGYDTMTIAEMPAGKSVRTLGARVLNDHLGGWGYPGPGAKLWLDASASATLFRDPENRPLVNLVIDGQRTSNSLFTASGKEAAWGNRDGTITVCDLEEIQRQLSAAGLNFE